MAVLAAEVEGCVESVLSLRIAAGFGDGKRWESAKGVA